MGRRSEGCPELESPQLVAIMLVLGSVGMASEVASEMFAPRVLLYLIVLGFGAYGLMRVRRARKRRGSAVLSK